MEIFFSWTWSYISSNDIKRVMIDVKMSVGHVPEDTSLELHIVE